MTYKDGDEYKGSCNKTARNAIIYIFCTPVEQFKIIEENNDRNDDTCGYIFKLNTPLICSYFNVSISENITTVAPPATTNTASSTTTTANMTTSNAASSATTANQPSKPASMGVFPILLIV